MLFQETWNIEQNTGHYWLLVEYTVNPEYFACVLFSYISYVAAFVRKFHPYECDATVSILHMQISAPFCFDCGRHLERSFATPKLLAGHSVCLWRYGPISRWRWIIFFIFVDVWPCLTLARGLYAIISIPEACVTESIVWSRFGVFQRYRRRWCFQRGCFQQSKEG